MVRELLHRIVSELTHGPPWVRWVYEHRFGLVSVVLGVFVVAVEIQERRQKEKAARMKSWLVQKMSLVERMHLAEIRVQGEWIQDAVVLLRAMDPLSRDYQPGAAQELKLVRESHRLLEWHGRLPDEVRKAHAKVDGQKV